MKEKNFTPVHIIVWRLLWAFPYFVGVAICVSMRFLMHGYQSAKECYHDLV